MALKSNIKKAQKLEAAGDALVAKGDYKKALKKYERAAKQEPDRPGLYDKLIDAHNKAKPEWKKEDFVESLSWTMKKQEIEEPAIRQVHAKLAPEWKKAVAVAVKLINAPDDETAKLTEELVAMGEIGTRVLVELLRLAKTQDQTIKRGE